jgi:hypothetical protein
LHQRDCLAPAASVQLEEGVGPGRTAATQVGENEFSLKRTFPDESVPLLPPKGAPAEIAGGVRSHPTRRGGGISPPPPCGANRSERHGSPQGINVTERLFVVSVSTSEVNWTVIGGLQSGLNVAVASIV